MTGQLSIRMKGASPFHIAIVFATIVMFLNARTARADEVGVSFWLPGQFGSLAAAPGVPGWSVAAVYYSGELGGSGAVAAAREIQIGRFPATANVNLNATLYARPSLVALNPTYTFASPVLGGQLTLGVTTVFGGLGGKVEGTLTSVVGPLVTTHMGRIADSVTGFGDLSPRATLKWNAGVHNFMTYLTGGIPVGSYIPGRLVNLGIGHGAIDGGGGYTYFNPETGREFSAVAGLTYNFKNPDTQYRSGVSLHLDWAAAQFLSKQVFVGVAGYAYQQVSDDVGAHPMLGGFRSRVFGAGPQAGYLFPVGGMQGVVNLKVYGEFASQNRPSGWNAWLAFAVSPVAAAAPAALPVQRTR